MINIIDTLYQKLHHYSNFSESCLYPDKFLKTSLAIVKSTDTSSMPILFKYFKDDPKEMWVFERVNMFMEYFYGDAYPLAAVKNIEKLAIHAPQWAGIILLNILKTPTYCEIFSTHCTYEERAVLLHIIRHLGEKHAKHKEFLQELASLLQRTSIQGEAIHA